MSDERIAHLTRELSRAFARLIQLRLAKHAVPLGHWTFLRILWVEDGLTQRELSARAGVMEPTTVVAMKSMESLGYILRAKHPDNKKNIYIHLTPRGRSLERKLVPIAEEINKISTASISSRNVTIARVAMLKMLENLSVAIDHEAGV